MSVAWAVERPDGRLGSSGEPSRPRRPAGARSLQSSRRSLRCHRLGDASVRADRRPGTSAWPRRRSPAPPRPARPQSLSIVRIQGPELFRVHAMGVVPSESSGSAALRQERQARASCSATLDLIPSSCPYPVSPLPIRDPAPGFPVSGSPEGILARTAPPRNRHFQVRISRL